jgi:hypothetical protein
MSSGPTLCLSVCLSVALALSLSLSLYIYIYIYIYIYTHTPEYRSISEVAKLWSAPSRGTLLVLWGARVIYRRYIYFEINMCAR